MRSSRPRSSARGLVPWRSVRASSMGSRPPSAPGPSTDRNQALPLSGGSSWTTSRARPVAVTGRDQRSRRLATSAPAATGAAKVEPSRRVTTDSAAAATVRTTGGGAGSSSRPAASVAMALTTEPITSSVTARGSPPPSARTGPGMALDSSSTSAWSRSAGSQRTCRSATRPSGRRTLRTLGTSAPRATSRTAATATRPIQVTLEPTPSPPRPAPTATSQPSESATGMDRAAARSPVGSGTPRCCSQPTAGPPMPSSRSDRSSWPAGGTSGPPAHTTTSPPDHDACSRTSPEGSGATSTAEAGSFVVVSRSYAASSRASSASTSAMTWLRSGPSMRRTASRLSSVSSSRRSSVRRQPGASASSSASCSSVAMPSTADQTAASRTRLA